MILFDSTVGAVQCAIEMQQEFQQEPVVPLRIGVHVGEVIRKGNDVFGNGINIASRVESMGVAGAVLISKDAQKRVKNQEHHDFVSLGHFNFKNVEEPIEVFALANQGLVVPTPEQLVGKQKAVNTSATNIFNKLLPFLLALLTLGAIGAWIASEQGWFDVERGETIAREFKDKRVAVMLFENQTLNPELDVFGKMISDWVTKGLMETGEANVISAANIQNQIAQASILGGGSEFYNATGVGVVIQGRYYLQEDQLMIHANVVDAEKGEVIHALDPIQGPRSKMMDLLQEFTEEILGYWSVRKQNRYLQNPPKYQAYQNMLEVERLWGIAKHYDRVEQSLLEAFRLDTTFYAPLLKLAVLYSNLGGNSEMRDSVLEFLEGKNPELSKWEKLRYDAVKEASSTNPDRLEVIRLNELIYAMDPSDLNASYNISWNSILTNYPQKAADQINGFDQNFRDMDSEYSWTEARLAEAYYMTGQYESVIQVAKRYSFPKRMRLIAVLHINSLIRMDSTEILDKVVEDYHKKGVFAWDGTPRDAGDLFQAICAEAYILNKNDLLKQYIDDYRGYISAQLEGNDYYYEKGLAFYLEQSYDQALSQWQLENRSPVPPRIYLFHPYLFHLSRLGIAHAKLGQIEESEKILAQISGFPAINNSNVQHWYHEAQVYTALGKRDEAMASLRKSIEGGQIFLPYGSFANDIFFKSLFNDPEFQELVRPKG